MHWLGIVAAALMTVRAAIGAALNARDLMGDDASRPRPRDGASQPTRGGAVYTDAARWSPPDQMTPAPIADSIQGTTSSSMSSREVVASKPSTRLALVVSGMRRCTSCSKGWSDT